MPGSRLGSTLVLPPRSSSLKINLLHDTCISVLIKQVELGGFGSFRDLLPIFFFFLTPGPLLLISVLWYP